VPTFSIGFADTGTLHIVKQGELVLRIDGDEHVERVSRGERHPAPARRPAPHEQRKRPRARDHARRRIRARRARKRAGALALRDVHFPVCVRRPRREVPATYLAHARLDAATNLLRDTSLPITLVAEQVGYASEAAFSRAFKHRYGTPPSRWRRDTRAT
jgi:transcriptional regulator GlxA family with amidase domain